MQFSKKKMVEISRLKVCGHAEVQKLGHITKKAG